MLVTQGGFSGFRAQQVEAALGLLWSRHSGTSAWRPSWCPVWTGACYWIWRPFSSPPLLRGVYLLASGLATDLACGASAFSWCVRGGPCMGQDAVGSYNVWWGHCKGW